MLLSRLQNQLAGFYAMPVVFDVYDFLITDARTAAALTPPGAALDNQERVLVRTDESALELSLYIDEAVLECLEHDDPHASLHEGNLNPFLIAVEGVSHLQSLIWHAEQDQQVSLLELELQAEIDKYVASADLLSRQGGIPDGLHARLFEDVRFDASVSADEQTRYQDANQLAARYCHALRRRYPGHHYQPSFMRELRNFYRLSEHQKVTRILALR